MNFIRTGFRTVRENPALIFAEIAWRWAFGAAAWLLVIVSLRMVFSQIQVSQAEVGLAHNFGNPYVIADVAAHFIVQALPQILAAALILVPALAIFWIASATLGRATTLRNLVGTAGFQTAASSRLMTPLLLLNALRALFTLATLLAFFGTVILVSSQITPNVAPFLLLAWLCLALVVGFLWGIVNWFLALAPIFVVRDGAGLWRSISESLGLYRGHGRDYTAIASWFGFFRGTALLLAIVAGSVVVASGSVRLALAGSIVVGLAYFAIADYFYIARLAAYVALAASGSAPVNDLDVAGPEPGLSLAPSETETETETQL